MSAIAGSFRSLVDHSSSHGLGVQRQNLGAKILWILMMVLAPLLCPVYLMVTICWVCMVAGRMSAETKVTIFVLMIFFAISWIPLVSLIVYLESDTDKQADVDQTAMVNGITPIAAYYLFTIWGIVVAFRRFKLTDAYEIETSRRDVACLKDIVIEPSPIQIPGAREMAKAMRASHIAKRCAFVNKPVHVPWYKRLFGLGNSGQSTSSSSSSVSATTIPGMMQKETDIIGDLNNVLGNSTSSYGHGQQTSPSKKAVTVDVVGATFIPPSDEDGQEENAVTINTVTEIANGLELYIHLKGEPKYVKVAALTAFALGGATVTVVRTVRMGYELDLLWSLSTIFFCGMFLVFYAVFAFIITMYLNQVRFIQRLTSSICGDRTEGIAWVRAHNLSHLRAWEAVRRLAVLEITNPDSVLNALFTPSLFLSALACLVIASYLVLRLLFMAVDIGPFILTLLVLFVLLLSFIILVTGVANYAQSHLKLHTSIIAQKTYEIAKLIDERYSDIERGLLVDTADTYSESSYASEPDFNSRSSLGSRARRNTITTNWEQANVEEEEIDEQLRNAMLVRNSSLADPEQARAQLQMLLQERGGKMVRKLPQTTTRREEGNATETVHHAPASRSNIHLPQYLQPSSGTIVVGFGSVDQKVMTTIKQQQQQQHQSNSAQHYSHPVVQSPHASHLMNSRSRLGSDLDRRSQHSTTDDDEVGTEDTFHRERERDTEGVEKLSIAALESCHASLLSLCNYFVANQPRPLILGMQLQNVRYAIVFVLLISGNLMFLALMIAFKRGSCSK